MPPAVRRSLEAILAVDLDFRQEGPQTWDIVIDTHDGATLQLSEGGAVLTIDDGDPQRGPSREYAGLYARFADLIVAAGASDADAAPLRIVADALLVAATERVPPFVDAAHHHVE